MRIFVRMSKKKFVQWNKFQLFSSVRRLPPRLPVFQPVPSVIRRLRLRHRIDRNPIDIHIILPHQLIMISVWIWNQPMSNHLWSNDRSKRFFPKARRIFLWRLLRNVSHFSKSSPLSSNSNTLSNLSSNAASSSDNQSFSSSQSISGPKSESNSFTGQPLPPPPDLSSLGSKLTTATMTQTLKLPAPLTGTNTYRSKSQWSTSFPCSDQIVLLPLLERFNLFT